MKNSKSLLALLLFINLFFSCDDNKENSTGNDTEQLDYSEIRLYTKNKIAEIDKIAIDETALKKEISKYFTLKESSEKLNSSTNTSSEFKINLAPHYNVNEANFMLLFYQDLANSYDSDIDDLIKSKRKILNGKSFSNAFKQEANLIFDVIHEVSDKVYSITKKTTKNTSYSKSNGFWSCMAGQGKNIGRGIAGGALSGAYTGAKAGLIAGSFTVPGLGTATGVIGGAVFGAAAGAVGGAAGAITWAAADCLSEIKKIETFPDENLKLAAKDIRLINSLLEVPEDSSITFKL
ncbi:hypothetical protein [Flavobacterium sp. CLA17]|uniref:hypothetical protein n=1 Tax=Flavobacterium sp. CLA17 TaxID=2724135 RepID=UPI001492D088|nr:hypothetical protein [Flavobacterium sp. CLA17]QSB26877.1 hypothetical protein HAV12_021345 [Flavobacterium sp. CLA17]